jgi:hypothetical protein
MQQLRNAGLCASTWAKSKNRDREVADSSRISSQHGNAAQQVGHGGMICPLAVVEYGLSVCMKSIHCGELVLARVLLKSAAGCTGSWQLSLPAATVSASKASGATHRAHFLVPCKAASCILHIFCSCQLALQTCTTQHAAFQARAKHNLVLHAAP